MSYCLNPECLNPQNLEGTIFCKSCGSKLLLKDRYWAIELLGEGGFGRTFIAQDIDRLNAYCVIKQFLPLSQVQQNRGLLEKATEMFNHEAEQLLKLGNHPQIPTLFADFEQEGRLYLIQEYIHGKNLLQELEERGAFSGEAIEKLLLDILPVLQYIHERNVIHRDIKPENILRRQSPPTPLFSTENSGELVLIDFGVAKQLTGSVLVKTGTKLGTEGYAPIEQLRGGKAYPASDLYSLGVTCIHLLTNTSPDELYDAMQASWLWHSKLLEMGVIVSERLSNVINKLLQDRVSDRYQSADEVIADLSWNLPSTNNLVPTHIASPQPSTGEIATHWKCIHTLASHENYVIDIAISPDNKTLASCSYDKTIKVWHLTSGTLQGTLISHTGWVSCVAISPDGKTLASGSLDNTVKLWELGSGNLKTTLTGHSAYVISMAISPDGKILASGCFDNTIKLWNLNAGTPIGTLTGHTGYVESLAISSDGKILASGGGYDDHSVNLWDLERGVLITTLEGHSASVRSVTFSPDNQVLVTGSEDKTIKVWDVKTKKVVYSLTTKSWVQAVAISPDSKILASGNRDTLINLWKLENGQFISSLKWHSGPITALEFSLNGRYLASSSWDNTVKIWEVES